MEEINFGTAIKGNNKIIDNFSVFLLCASEQPHVGVFFDLISLVILGIAL